MPGMPSRTFSSMSRRVAAARAELELFGVDDDEFAGGLAALSKRKKLKKAEDLAARARHELNKARYALPSEASPARCSRLARCGFDHSQLIVETLRNSVKGADEEQIKPPLMDMIKAHADARYSDAIFYSQKLLDIRQCYVQVRSLCTSTSCRSHWQSSHRPKRRATSLQHA